MLLSLLCLAPLLSVSSMFAVPTRATPPSRLVPIAAQEQDSKVLTVIGRGVGLDPSSAETDALRSAVEQAVGLLLDAETILENDDVVEKILTYSGAYIEKFEVLETKKEDNGLIRVKVRAEVKKTQLEEKLVEEKVIRAKISGKSLFAKARSKIEEQKSSAEVFRRAFEGFPLGVLTAKLEGEPDVLDQDDESLRLGVKIRFEIDQEAWARWAATVDRLLGPVARELGTIRPPQESATGFHVRNYKEALAECGAGQQWSVCSYKKLLELAGITEDRDTFLFFVAEKPGPGQAWRWYRLARNPLLAEAGRPFGRYPLLNISLLDDSGATLTGAQFGCSLTTSRSGYGWLQGVPMGYKGHNASFSNAYFVLHKGQPFADKWVVDNMPTQTQQPLMGSKTLDMEYVTAVFYPAGFFNNSAYFVDSFVVPYSFTASAATVQNAAEVEVRMIQQEWSLETIHFTSRYGDSTTNESVPYEITDQEK